MAYRYRNVKTGEIVTTSNRVGGKRWEPVEEAPTVPPEDDFVEGFENKEEPEATPEKEHQEAPVEKPAAKPSRKGKK